MKDPAIRPGGYSPIEQDGTDGELPTISVIIPVKNESKGIAQCLQGVLEQTVKSDEIIVIDSGSSDGTQGIVNRFPNVRLIEIPSEEFNHGDTRNLGIGHASGDIVVFTVGDARPTSREWIRHLLDGFVADDVVAVSGAQVVPEDSETNPIEWFKPQSVSKITVFRYPDVAAFGSERPETRWQATSLDDVTAAYRRDYLAKHPFRRIVYGEDVLFAKDALLDGQAIAFNPNARVYHYHHESYETILKRTVAVASLRYQVTGYLTPRHKFVATFCRAAARLLLDRRLGLSERIKWLRYNFEVGRALRDGLKKIHIARARGGDAMQSLHENYCGTPPMPLKPPATPSG